MARGGGGGGWRGVGLGSGGVGVGGVGRGCKVAGLNMGSVFCKFSSSFHLILYFHQAMLQSHITCRHHRWAVWGGGIAGNAMGESAGATMSR